MEGDVYGASHTNENGDTYEIADQTVSFGYEDYMIAKFPCLNPVQSKVVFSHDTRKYIVNHAQH